LKARLLLDLWGIFPEHTLGLHAVQTLKDPHDEQRAKEAERHKRTLRPLHKRDVREPATCD